MTKKTNVIYRCIVAITLTALLVVFSGCSYAACMMAAYNMPEAVEYIYDNTLIVNNITEDGQSFAGTGFVVESGEDGVYAITNYHVVADSKLLTVDYGKDNENTCHASVVGWYEYHDIAVIALDTDAQFNQIDEERFISPTYDEAAYSMGNEYGLGKKVFRTGKTTDETHFVETEKLGWYDAYDEVAIKCVPVAEYSCSVESGMSGCPIADGNGNITGVGTYRMENSKNYYGVDARIAHSVYAAVRSGEFNAAIGSGAEKGKEVNLFGEGYYRLFADYDNFATEFVFLGNYYSWNVSGKLHDIGFTANVSDHGWRVTRAGAYSPVKAGDVITKFGDRPVSDSVSDVMVGFYNGMALTDGYYDTRSVVTIGLSDGREVNFCGGGYAVVTDMA